MKSQRFLIREYGRRLREGNGTFEDIYDAQFSQKGNVFFEFLIDGKMASITFGEVEKQIDSLASYLLAFLKGKKDQYIALNIDNSVEWAVGFYAILKSGNKPYLVNLRHPIKLTLGILKTLKIEYSLDHKVPNPYGIASILIDDHLQDEVGQVDYPWANELAISTSATTMQEKIVLYTGKEILEQLRNTDAILGHMRMIRKTYGGTIKLLGFLPFYHIFGLITTFFWFTYFGYEIVLLSDYSPQTILTTIRLFKVTHVFAVPLFYHEIEKNVLSEVAKAGKEEKFQKAMKLSLKLPSSLSIWFARRAYKEIRSQLFGDSVRFCIVGGSYIRPSALSLLNGLGYPLFNGYGTSEVGITSCDFSKRVQDRLLCSIGKPFDSATYELSEGCLCVSGLSTCYATIVNGEFKETGHAFDTLDLCVKDEEGRYYIKGRKSDLIVSKNGENINPDDLETQFDLSSYRVLNSVILGLGEHKDEPSFIIEVQSDITPIEAEKLKQGVLAQNDSVEATHRLSHVYLTFDALQSPGAIKVSRSFVYAGIDKKSIRLHTFEDLFQKEEASLGEIEKVVRSIFAKNLQLDEEKIGLTSDFAVDLGGTSLSYYAILVDLNERFKLNLGFDPEKPLFTVEAFSKAIKEELSKQ